jgi:hypothetical protein
MYSIIPDQQFRLKYDRYKYRTGIDYKEIEGELQYFPKTSENAMLFIWIKMNTDKSSIFIDSDNLIPVFTKRRLFFAEGKTMNKKGTNRDENYRLDFDVKYYLRLSLYNKEKVEFAKKIKKAIIELERPSNSYIKVDSKLRKKAINYLQSLNEDIYVVIRKNDPPLNDEIQSFFYQVFSYENTKLFLLKK